MSAMIQVDNLTYHYPETKQPALRDISLTVAQGETLGVMGANGAGKSTLCYAIMGLVPHFYKGKYAGTVKVDGIDVRRASLGEMAQHAVVVFQNPMNQFSGSKLTVVDEIAFGMENLGFSRQVMHERMDWVSELLGIGPVLDRNPFQLSGGQMQRVAIASVLALRPKVLILDEPTSQLDPAGTSDVFQAVRTLQQEGITTVIVEHKTELLVQYADRLCILDNGGIVEAGSAGELFGRFQSGDILDQSKGLKWGVEIPRYAQAYKKLHPDAQEVPVTLEEATSKLRREVEDNADGPTQGS